MFLSVDAVQSHNPYCLLPAMPILCLALFSCGGAGSVRPLFVARSSLVVLPSSLNLVFGWLIRVIFLCLIS